MKMNNKGFFLAETIIIVALVTTVMAFVYPNVAKLYDNYKNRALYYDQTGDLYNLKAIYELDFTDIDEKCSEIKNDNNKKASSTEEIRELYTNKLGFEKIYIIPYMTTALLPSNIDNYNFNKYLKRLKKVNNDEDACRLIGVRKEGQKEFYSSIKLEKDSVARAKYTVPDLKKTFYVVLNGVKSCTSNNSSAVTIVLDEINNKCKITGANVANNVVITVKTTNDVDVISNIKVTD